VAIAARAASALAALILAVGLRAQAGAHVLAVAPRRLLIGTWLAAHVILVRSFVIRHEDHECIARATRDLCRSARAVL
jgi:hypothetical protein